MEAVSEFTEVVVSLGVTKCQETIRQALAMADTILCRPARGSDVMEIGSERWRVRP